LCATCTVATGTIDVYVDRQRVTGGAYANSSPIIQVTPKSGTVKYSLGRIAASRYMTGKVVNNGIGASLTNVTLGYELFKVS
ncbi:MAG: hypothetical protein KGL35_05245, partial [Bradyrhizobium sp.]|nr:hypothetical protein [Bradyrhizobium sp.]